MRVAPNDPGQREVTHPRAKIQRVKCVPAAITYCSKEKTRVDGPWERGERPRGKGKRTDIEEARDALLEGADDAYMIGRRLPGPMLQAATGAEAMLYGRRDELL